MPVRHADDAVARVDELLGLGAEVRERLEPRLDQEAEGFGARSGLLGDGTHVIDELKLRVQQAQEAVDVVRVERRVGTPYDLDILRGDDRSPRVLSRG